MIEMKLTAFISAACTLIEFIKNNDIDVQDPKYIVRLDPKNNRLEIGFPEDKWEITK